MSYDKSHPERWMPPGSLWITTQQLTDLTDLHCVGVISQCATWRGHQLERDEKIVVLRTVMHRYRVKSDVNFNLEPMKSDGFALLIDYLICRTLQKGRCVYPSMPIWYHSTANCLTDAGGWNRQRAVTELVQQWRIDFKLVERGS